MTHATSGAALWLAGSEAARLANVAPSPRAVIIGAGACAVGALLPDLDSPGSLASRFLPPVTTVLSWLTRKTSRLAYRATATDRDERHGREGTHRFLAHTAWFAAFVGVLVAVGLTVAGHRWLPLAGWAWLGLPLGAGCLVHISGDWCTKSGVPIGWPFVVMGERWRRFGAPLRITTGKWVESVFGFGFVLLGLGSAWLLARGYLHDVRVVVPATVHR